MSNLIGDSNNPQVPGVVGTNMATGGVGVEAISMQGIALLAKTQSTAAVYASSKTGPG